MMTLKLGIDTTASTVVVHSFKMVSVAGSASRALSCLTFSVVSTSISSWLRCLLIFSRVSLIAEKVSSMSMTASKALLRNWAAAAATPRAVTGSMAAMSKVFVRVADIEGESRRKAGSMHARSLVSVGGEVKRASGW